MKTLFNRRSFLKTSAALAGTAAAGFSCVELASAAPIQVPTVDKLSMRVLVDQQHDQFLRGSTVNGVVHEGPGPGRSADARNVLHNEWGLSLFLESERANEQRTILLDFGYTAPAIINNMIEAFSELKKSGVTILLVEQNINFAQRLGDTVAVMDNGAVVHTGSMAAFSADEALQQSLLGLAL